MVARVIAAASGTLTIWLVYKLALRLFDRLTAITAAFFVAVAFLHVRDRTRRHRRADDRAGRGGDAAAGDAAR
jgi:hypothetical protein